MKNFFVIFLLLLLLYIAYLMSPLNLSSSEEVRFVVPLDEKKETTLQRLLDTGLVKNEYLLNIVATLSDISAFDKWQIEPGSYILKKNYWLPKTVNILLYHPYQKWVLIKPGLRKEQVSEILSEKFQWDVLKEKDFLENAQEGYLFPDTYLLNIDYTAKEYVQKFMNNFNEKFDAQMQKDLLTANVLNTTAIKIASLIERESGSLEDKPIIAGIIWNRLDTDMRLQIDATTQYIIGTRGNWWPRVRPEDHKIESAYNTYLNKGLPPTPISNPSLDSIRAAVYPAKTDCIFYLHDENKQIHCTKTYEEHLENIEKYLK